MNKRQLNPKYWLRLIITTPFVPHMTHTKYSSAPKDDIYDNSAFPGIAHFPDNKLESFSFDPNT